MSGRGGKGGKGEKRRAPALRRTREIEYEPALLGEQEVQESQRRSDERRKALAALARACVPGTPWALLVPRRGCPL